MRLADDRRRWVWGALLLAGWLTLWIGRSMLEQRMLWHMAVQLPLLLAVGIGAAQWQAAPSVEARGAAGLPSAILGSTGVALWMIPRLLDAAVEDPRLDAIKFLSVPLSGYLLALALPRALPPVRLFVVGNVAFMTAVVGTVLIDSPERLCVSYGTSDQRVTGYALIALALAASTAAVVSRRLRRW